MGKNAQGQSYWLGQNSLWESSGLSQEKFCEQQDLIYKQFVYWRGRLNKNKGIKAEPKLMKVSTIPACLPSVAVAEPSSYLEVILPTGIKLHIKTEADISKASALIQLLGGVR